MRAYVGTACVLRALHADNNKQIMHNDALMGTLNEQRDGILFAFERASIEAHIFRAVG